MPEQEPSRLHLQLAAELGRLRSLAGVSQREMATLAGISQPTVLRIERAESRPSMKTVKAWLDATMDDDATDAPEIRKHVETLTEALHLQTVRWSELLQNRGHLQDAVRDRELESVRVQNFQPTVIAGLLQTPAYTRALLPITDITQKLDHEATIAGRIQRQQVLYEQGRQFEFILAEHVLMGDLGGGVMAGQIDRLLQIAELPTVEIAVLPSSAMAATAWSNFVIHTVSDDTASYVTLELVHGTQRLSAATEVELYRKVWERLWAASLTGDAVHNLLSRSRAD